MPKDKIKQLSIEFNSDAANFNKGLNQMNKELNQVGKTANEIQKQIDNAFDPNDITPFTKKLSLVETELAGTEQKAELLRKELENIDDTDLNSQQILKLEQNLAKAETSAGQLRKEQKRLNNDIEALETKEYEKLSKRTKKAAKNTGTLTNEQIGFNKSIQKTAPDIEKTNVSLGDLADVSGVGSSSIGGLATEIVGTTSKLGALGLAAGAAGGAIAVMYNEFKQTKEASLALAGDINLINTNAKELNKTASRLSKTFGVEYSEGIEIAKTSTKLFKKEMQTNQGAMDSYITTVGLMNLKNLDLERGISAIDKAQTNFNISQKEGVALLISADQAVQQFGTSADDLLDAYVEFGDTAAYAKLTAEDYFKVLNTGMILGAKNYDEVANAVNELILRTEAGTDATKGAFASIGVSYEEASKKIKDGNIGEVLVDIITGLSQVDNKTAISAELMGTYGEEFVATLAGNKEAVDALVESQQIVQTQTEILSELYGTLSENFGNYAANLGLTVFQQDNLKTVMEEGFQPTVDYLDSIGKLDETLGFLSSKLELTPPQISILSEAFAINKRDGEQAALSYLDQMGVLDQLAEKHIISAGQVDNFKKSQDNLKNSIEGTKNKLIDYSKDLLQNGEDLGLSEKNVTNLRKAYYKLGDNTSTAQEKQWAFEDALQATKKITKLTNNDISDLGYRYSILTDDTATTTEKQQALADIQDDLKNKNMPALKKELEKMAEAYGDLNTPLADSAESTEDMTDDIIQINKKLSPTPKKVDDLKDSVKDSINPMNDFAGAIAGAGQELGTLNGQIDNINSKAINVPTVNVATPPNQTTRAAGRLTELAPLTNKYNFKDINISIKTDETQDVQAITNNITENVVNNIVEEMARRY